MTTHALRSRKVVSARWMGLLAAVCGCNAVFGLRETAPVDATYFDAPIDAPARCPAPGGEPLFRPAYTQVPVNQCFSYVPSASGHALARCQNTMWHGPVDGELQPATFVTASQLNSPRLAPEGDLAIVGVFPGNTFELFRRAVDDSWVHERQVFGALPTRDVSTPSRGPDRRAMVVEFDTDHYQLTEIRDTGGSPWEVVDSYPASVLDVIELNSVSLTADGLRLVFKGSSTAGDSGVFQSERPNLSARFGPARLLTTVSNIAETPFMTEDCGRIYFAGLDTVFYLAQ